MSDERTEHVPVGVVLVSHSREVAESAAQLATTLAGGSEGPRVTAAGGTGDGGVGTSSELITRAVRRADAGGGVAILADLGGAVLTVQALLDDSGELPDDVLLLDAPFLEGAIAAVAAVAAGGGLTEVVQAAEQARNYRKL